MPDLVDLFQQKKEGEGIYIFKGMEGYRNALRDIIDVGENGYTIGGKGIWTNPESDPLVQGLVKGFAKKNMQWRTLFDATTKEQVKSMGKQPHLTYRFLPEKYSSPTAVSIYADRVVLYVSDNLDTPTEDLTIFMMVSKKLADSYKKWFEFMWDHSTSLAVNSAKKPKAKK